MLYSNTSMLSPHFRSILRGYQDFLQVEKGHRPLTINHKVKAVRTFVLRTGIDHITEIDYETVKSFFYEQVKERNWSPHNQRNYWTYLRCFIDWCLLNRKLQLRINPVNQIGKPKKPKTVPRRISKDQLNRLFAECCTFPWKYDIQRARNVAIFATFVYTGMRLNELINIRREDVSIDNRTILIREGKGGKVRIVTICLELKRFLADYELHLTRLKVSSEFYFCSVGGKKRLNNKDIYRMRDRLSEATGIRFCPHELRHTFASMALEQKIPVASISKFLGHESIVYTEGYLAPEQKILLSHFDDFKRSA
ncbi:MAG: tyrosine-type recombinase/integrase [Bacteroidota bacterium]